MIGIALLVLVLGGLLGFLVWNASKDDEE